MGNGNINVGNKTAIRKPGPPIVEHLAESDGAAELRIANPHPPKAERAGVFGAMSQQYGGDGGRGNESSPQKFVRLVGCRDPKAGQEPWVRPSSVLAKR